MVRTLRSIEEEARVRQVYGPGVDACLADRETMDALEAHTVADLMRWSAEGVRRVLVVGLEDRGRVALAFARINLFVTVVDPDEALVNEVRAAAEEAKCAQRMNFYASDYMHREFMVSGFDLAVFFAALSRYNEPMVVLRKAERELRAGGKLFARIRVRPAIRVPRVPAAAAPHVGRVSAWLGKVSNRVPGLSRYLALPGADRFLAELGEVLKVERVERSHLFAGAVARLAQSLKPAGIDIGGAVPVASRADEAILGSGPLRSLSTHMVVYAVKELGLGKTFSL